MLRAEIQDVFVAPGYEQVHDTFARNLPSSGRGGAAFCAYVGGRVVVDVWGGFARADVPWRADTTAVLMSATKGLTALCVQLLVDRGRLDIESPLATYWPEFAQHGKDSVTVRHLLLHQAGLLGFPGQTEQLRFDGRGFDDYDEIARGFAAAPLQWAPGTQHGYHALSYGWLVGEVVRRVTGQTIGTYFDEQVAQPLGLDTWIGTPPEQLSRVAQVLPTDPTGLPRWMRRFQAAALAVARDETSLTGQAFLGGNGTSVYEHIDTLFSNDRFLGAELAAGNATSTARSLARVFAMLAQGGELDGVRLLTEPGVKRFAVVQLNEPDRLTQEVPQPWWLGGGNAPVPRTLGYLGNRTVPGLSSRFGPNMRAFGVEGFGGQLAYADPANQVGAAYVRNHLSLVDIVPHELADAVYACAQRTGDIDQPVKGTSSRRPGPVDAIARTYWRRLQRRTRQRRKGDRA